MDTFAARGYNNASLAEIADRVGLTQAGVLHYFRSKALLLTSVLELRDQRDIEHLGPDRPQGLDFLRHLVNTALRNAEREGIVRLYAVLSAESVTDDHPAQDYFRDRYHGLRAFVADALREACEPCGRPGGPDRQRGQRHHRGHGRPAGPVAPVAGIRGHGRIDRPRGHLTAGDSRPRALRPVRRGLTTATGPVARSAGRPTATCPGRLLQAVACGEPQQDPDQGGFEPQRREGERRRAPPFDLDAVEGHEEEALLVLRRPVTSRHTTASRTPPSGPVTAIPPGAACTGSRRTVR